MQSGRRVPRTDFLQIRVTPEDKRRIDEAAAAHHLDTSTWARQVLLRALDAPGAAPASKDKE